MMVTAGGCESPRSPQSPGHYAAGFAMGLNESSHGNVFGSPRGGYTDRRCITIDMDAGTGLHRGRSPSPAPASPGTKFERLRALQALDHPYLDFSLDVVPCRRHSPAPVRHDPRNEILQALDAYEHTAILGRRAPMPRQQRGEVETGSMSPRRPPVPRFSTPDSQPSDAAMETARSGKAGKDDPKKAMDRSIRRLDTAAAKLEKVAKALVEEAQRQSLAQRNFGWCQGELVLLPYLPSVASRGP
ncbi:unnamed protein product [Symbiodinium natans]|uniref:Uncharacterized protein n=1 Tax=Symbiodinium natans TaxID=878477 RepID=A0A812UUX5_9DINO|nr:unnamed protein product [Symbiodinium natans]